MTYLSTRLQCIFEWEKLNAGISIDITTAIEESLKIYVKTYFVKKFKNYLNPQKLDLSFFTDFYLLFYALQVTNGTHLQDKSDKQYSLVV